MSYMPLGARGRAEPSVRLELKLLHVQAKPLTQVAQVSTVSQVSHAVFEPSFLFICRTPFCHVSYATPSPLFDKQVELRRLVEQRGAWAQAWGRFIPTEKVCPVPHTCPHVTTPILAHTCPHVTLPYVSILAHM